MRQLLLNLEPPEPPSLGSFVAGRNREAASLLAMLASARGDADALPLDQRFVYLWGAAGAGKSHLLHALAATPGARYVAAGVIGTDPAGSDASPNLRRDLHADLRSGLRFDPQVRLYLIDDCDQLGPEAQIAAFALYNQVREHGAALVASGAAPPLQLALREDLRTRLGWGLVYQLHELSDAEKIQALTHSAETRSLLLSPGVLPYLITHFQRDMRSLSAMLDALDRYSLETQRPITLPLLRSLLQREGDSPA